MRRRRAESSAQLPAASAETPAPDPLQSPLAKQLIDAAQRASQKLNRALEKHQNDSTPVTAQLAHGIGAALVEAFRELSATLRSNGISDVAVKQAVEQIEAVRDEDADGGQRKH